MARNLPSNSRFHRFKTARAFYSSVACVTSPSAMRCTWHALRWRAPAAPDLDEARAALKRVVSEGLRASEVIGAIRLMFKKDDQADAPQDVNELVREVLTLIRGEVENQSVSVRTEL